MTSKIRLVVATALALGAASCANAGCITDMFTNVSPYAGGDFKYWDVSRDNNEGNFFRKDYYGGSAFIGARWCKMIGLEFGYDFSDRKSNYNTSDGFAVLAGDTLADGTVVRTRTKFSGPYLDLSGYYPLFDCVELIGTVGISNISPKTHIDVNSNDGNGFVSREADGDSAVVARVGGGLQYMITDYIGMRTILRWENTSQFKINLNNAAGVGKQIKPFDDAFTATLGLFVSFF